MQRTDGVSGESKTYYLHTDHLGSVVSVTDAGGTLTPKPDPTDPTISQRYYAYGRERVGKVSDLPTDYAFTGQKQDSTGLMYFNARYFDPQIGAFISPDTLIPTPTDLYSYNRYMAFRGNPMKYTDPTGHWIHIAAGAALGGIIGGAAYYWNESRQDGFSWKDDWKDLAVATGGGMLAGGLLATGIGAVGATATATSEGLLALGSGMAGSQVQVHTINLMTHKDFSSGEFAIASAAGAAGGYAGQVAGQVVGGTVAAGLTRDIATIATNGATQGTFNVAGGYLNSGNLNNAGWDFLGGLVPASVGPMNAGMGTIFAETAGSALWKSSVQAFGDIGFQGLFGALNQALQDYPEDDYHLQDYENGFR